jgi:NTP pyrophosphatase (non-canonical NTP hydrolase)
MRAGREKLPSLRMPPVPWLHPFDPSVADRMTERIQDLAELKLRLRRFVEERDWDQFHSPKNLAMALSVEASELVEIFQWLTEAESAVLDEGRKQRAAAELADILVYLVRIADRLDIDLLQAVAHKLAENARKYPVERVRGKALKYDEYD